VTALRRFSPKSSFCIRDAKGQALAYVYYEDKPGPEDSDAPLDPTTRRGGSPITIHPTARRLGSKCIQSIAAPSLAPARRRVAVLTMPSHLQRADACTAMRNVL
jgi:hypothetical protein